jgi:hypothetical protein
MALVLEDEDWNDARECSLLVGQLVEAWPQF